MAPIHHAAHDRCPDSGLFTRPPSPFQRISRLSRLCGYVPCPWLRSLGRGCGLNCVRDARTPDQGGADPERVPICIWVSSTGFRQPGLLCAFRRRLVTVHVSPVSPSLNKEGNAACARQVCRKVTTRETRDQRRISTWYQNLRVLSAQSFGRQPERVSALPINFR